MNWKTIWIVAKKEAATNFSNYWFLLVACLLMVVNLSVIYFSGALQTGELGHSDLRAMQLTVINLQMYILPLLSLILSYDGILKERELGTFDLLLSYPIRFIDLIFGKWLGYGLVLSVAFLLGFAPTAYFLVKAGTSFSHIGLFVLLSIWLGISFNALGLVLSSLSKDRTLVISACIILWVFFVFLFDLGFIAIVVLTNGAISNTVISSLLLLNPAEIFRIISIMNLLPLDAKAVFGLDVGFLTTSYMSVALLLWSVFPFSVFFIKKLRQ